MTPLQRPDDKVVANNLWAGSLLLIDSNLLRSNSLTWTRSHFNSDVASTSIQHRSNVVCRLSVNKNLGLFNTDD